MNVFSSCPPLSLHGGCDSATCVGRPTYTCLHPNWILLYTSVSPICDLGFIPDLDSASDLVLWCMHIGDLSLILTTVLLFAIVECPPTLFANAAACFCGMLGQAIQERVPSSSRSPIKFMTG